MSPDKKKGNPEHAHTPDGSPEAAGSAPSSSAPSPATGSAEAVEEVTEQPPQGPQFLTIHVNRCTGKDCPGHDD